jgi:hypothetical protein
MLVNVYLPLPFWRNTILKNIIVGKCINHGSLCFLKSLPLCNDVQRKVKRKNNLYHAGTHQNGTAEGMIIDIQKGYG